MNKQIKKEIKQIINEILELKSKLDNIIDKEQISYDNIPDNFKVSQHAMESETALELLGDCSDDIDSVVDTLNDIL